MSKRIIVLRRADMSDDDIARFWKKVDRSGDCWVWKATKIRSRRGGLYGSFGFKMDKVLAHRFAYAIAHGECPTNRQIDHMCRNTLCVNPAHLQAVTQQQNMENIPANKRSKSGIRDVHWNNGRKKWQVKVFRNGKYYFVGWFTDIKEAEKAAIKKRNELMTNNLLDRKK